MSFVGDQIRRVDHQLDRLHLAFVAARRSQIESRDSESSDDEDITQGHEAATPAGVRDVRTIALQAVVRALSTTNAPRTVLRRSTIIHLLQTLQLDLRRESGSPDESDAELVNELEWLILGKATAQTYGVTLDLLLEQILPLNDDLWYWERVLGSHRYTALYSVQTSPLRLYDWSLDIYRDVRRRFASLKRRNSGSDKENEAVTAIVWEQKPFKEKWNDFYRLVKTSIDRRALTNIRTTVISPITLVENEIRSKQTGLKKLIEMSASGLGILMDEGLSLEAEHDAVNISKSQAETKSSSPEEDWKNVVEKSIALLETVLHKVTADDVGVNDFDDVVFANIDNLVDLDDADEHESSHSQPAALAKRLQFILATQIPAHTHASSTLIRKYGRPSVWIRYWLPSVILILSSGTLLRILTRRKAAVREWIRETGQTLVDFWFNWIVQPTKKVIGTIRHDKDSEIAIMSKESLEGDRASLERMVVDFAVDKPSVPGSKGLSEGEISSIRAKVREGDLTPVLKAYEHDLRRPFMGTVRGDLIRTLLIQIQKTKVDVEVAMGGIDALLKSQELVFGFVGLTPGILVVLSLGSWLTSTFGRRGGAKRARQEGQMVRSLRNIDRILTAASPTSHDTLSYRDHGLLLCEVYVMRTHAAQVLPRQIERELIEDLDDLVDVRTGVARQLKVVERVRWAYAKWWQ